MSYTFGGATTDDIAWGGHCNYTVTDGSSLHAGWFYPTTLTATRGLWSVGNQFGAEIDATTSELRLKSDNVASGDGEWTTSGLGLVVNVWQFLAVFMTANNSGPTIAWRVWRGTLGSQPVIQTPSVAVAPSSNMNSQTAAVIGNKGTGSVAFQGDIGWVAFVATQAAAISNMPWHIATSGAISDAEASVIERVWVLPLWRGQWTRSLRWTRGNDIRIADATNVGGVARGSSSTIGSNPSLSTQTFNGVVYSHNQPPIRPPSDLFLRPMEIPASSL